MEYNPDASVYHSFPGWPDKGTSDLAFDCLKAAGLAIGKAAAESAEDYEIRSFLHQAGTALNNCCRALCDPDHPQIKERELGDEVVTDSGGVSPMSRYVGAIDELLNRIDALPGSPIHNDVLKLQAVLAWIVERPSDSVDQTVTEAD